MAMRPQSSSDTSPNKRVKILTQGTDSPSFISKGKSKIQGGMSPPIHEEVENESADCCGICLSEAGIGGVSRGFIDSCSHYFCFVCIMEWAKVESKCPLCKRRFSTIRRPPKPPIFTLERVVHVPVRDQVYHYFGNATIGLPDLYSEAKCSVCHGIADESLLLLCDLCDCAAHTYCVGLGVTVPEGDWFCQDCTLLRDEHLRSETNTEPCVHFSFDPVHNISSINEHVSMFDIVQEPWGHAVQRHRSTSSDSRYLPPPSSNEDETSKTNNTDRTSPRSLEIVKQRPTKSNARTLRHCHDRIRVLRENWNGFRSGIMNFSSSPDDVSISTQKSISCTSGRNSVSCFNQQSTAQCSSSTIANDIGAYEIEKAWKMMDKATAVKQSCERSSIARHNSKHNIRKLNAVKNAGFSNYTHLSSDHEQNGSNNVGSIGPENHYPSLEKDYHKQPSLVTGNWNLRRHMTEDISYCEGSIPGHSPKPQGLESSKAVLTPSFLCSARVRSGEKLQAESLFKRSACLSSSVLSGTVVLNADAKRVDHLSSSHSKVKHLVEQRELKKICVDSQKYNDAKSEIQSLVKLNLKLQTGKEKLEVDAFKEVARLATHSILAACGLEHPKPGSCSIPGFKCCHLDEVQQLQKVSLMTNCCSECFYEFVKEIVHTIVMQKKTT